LRFRPEILGIMAAKKDCLTAVLCDRVMAAHSATAACAAVSELCRKRDDFFNRPLQIRLPGGIERSADRGARRRDVNGKQLSMDGDPIHFPVRRNTTSILCTRPRRRGGNRPGAVDQGHEAAGESAL